MNHRATVVQIMSSERASLLESPCPEVPHKHASWIPLQIDLGDGPEMVNHDWSRKPVWEIPWVVLYT